VSPGGGKRKKEKKKDGKEHNRPLFYLFLPRWPGKDVRETKEKGNKEGRLPFWAAGSAFVNEIRRKKGGGGGEKEKKKKKMG